MCIYYQYLVELAFYAFCRWLVILDKSRPGTGFVWHVDYTRNCRVWILYLQGFVFLNQVGDLGWFFGCFVNFIPYMYSLALKTDDKSIITGMLYCIYIFIIIEIYIPDLTTIRISNALSNLFFSADQRTLSISLSGVLLACSLGQYLLFFSEFDFMHVEMSYFELLSFLSFRFFMYRGTKNIINFFK